MFYLRYYHCFACGQNFTMTDGVICHPPVGVICKHCGSRKTVENPLGKLLKKGDMREELWEEMKSEET